ncbi:CRISPR-associated Cas3 family helicase [Halopolyspora algeriensis]|uniref:CRISPR-associated Cas3 family helicase n=1 Tax=Halopolyspora algeriensis TaxID=1500506 RepID=A0A368VY16_9ACTN|nr:CRISPR-associated helicase Cas3' [Halopolyspora algeriensis]RCW45127.1 CRISPR-associated Cas3 family helicase [Halopolyspora algeriensis]TQM53151.1 CRISPR-associated Cas3 family helicase [Halopolyspora algeriensis]
MWAHSANWRGERHRFSDHARGTAAMAGRFGTEFGAGELAHALGLFHDAGKVRCAWQERLRQVETEAGRVGIPHKDLGAYLLRSAAGVAALPVLGHHGGLTSAGELKDLRLEDASPGGEVLSRFLAEVPEAAEVLERAPLSLIPAVWRDSKLASELGIRLVFSSLVDADHLDTAAHFDGLSTPRVREDSDMAQLRDHFEWNRRRLIAGRAASPIDDLREQVYREAVHEAAGPTGIYRMPAPTGVGKTLSAAGFALHHAARTGKKRVVVAVPFITVTEQNAEVYRELLGQDTVLEHHSAVDVPESAAEAQRLRLAAENWDAPFVVTTTVQLFDSLFARKPARMRKLHRLANSVVILDEVQALPLHVLTPILDALRTLSERFGTTVLLTSATQPSFESLDVWNQLEIPNVVKDPDSLFKQLRRVRYEWWVTPKPSLAEVVSRAGEHEQSLMVVNTTADARTVYQQWQYEGVENPFHLSTRMCAAHRRAVLAEVNDLLACGKPVRLVSTQLIEAGVDVDFPVVYRAMAPAEAVQQAAGRANREGKRAESGLVTVFDAEDMGSPAGYRIGSDATRGLFGPQQHGVIDPDDLGTLDLYYRRLYQRSNTEHAERARTIQESRAKFDFTAVAEGPLRPGGAGQVRDAALAFRMLDDDTVPVVVTDYESTAEDLIDELRGREQGIGDVLRRLQPYIVSLPRRVLDDRGVCDLCKPIVAGLDLSAWRGDYHSAYGIDTSNLINEEVW